MVTLEERQTSRHSTGSARGNDIVVSLLPFVLVRCVPGNTWKTVTDAWNEYHSVALREFDRHLTTFIKPYGHIGTPGPLRFLSSGDGFNRRFQSILSQFGKKERCVDDTIFYDEHLSDHWLRAVEFFTRLQAAGIALNIDKFQFCQIVIRLCGISYFRRYYRTAYSISRRRPHFSCPQQHYRYTQVVWFS